METETETEKLLPQLNNMNNDRLKTSFLVQVKMV
jgi:hypothetical protein